MTGISSEPDDFDPPLVSPYAVYFQPDTGHLLELLGSDAVHGTSMAAVTELVLNAFNAIRSRVAHQRLALPAAADAADPKWDHFFREEDQVILELFENADGRFLRCSDTGIGLDAEIISQQMLCPGKPPGPDWRKLDQLCQARGFQLPGRTARGLGFLTYFMLADAVKIRSRRYNPNGEVQIRNVVFKSEGPRSRSLLRSLPADFDKPGPTQVTLRLKADAARPGTSFDHALTSWLRENLIHTPCPLFVFSEKSDHVFPAGWLPESPDVTPKVISSRLRELGLKRLPTTSATRDLLTAMASMPAEDLPQAGIGIGVDVWEYHVTGLATVRCSAPWITYRGIRAMVWATDAPYDKSGGQFTLVALTRHNHTAWRGIRCRISGAALPGFSMKRLVGDHGAPAFILQPWGFLTLDIDLDEPPVETLALNRRFVNLTASIRTRLEEFCLKSLQHMIGQVRRKHRGTLLAEQMEELEEHFREQI